MKEIGKKFKRYIFYEIFENYKNYIIFIISSFLILLFIICIGKIIGLSEKQIKDIFAGIGLVYIVYQLLFNLENLEKFLIKNLTKFLFILIFIVIYYQKFLLIGNKDTLYMIGAIFAFWYGYKKYERDKIINTLKIYNNKYNILKKKHKSGEIINYLEKLFNLWREEFFLYEEGYINNNLWKIWENHIIRDLKKLTISTSKEEIPMKTIISFIRSDKYETKNINFHIFIKKKYEQIYIEYIYFLNHLYYKNNLFSKKIISELHTNNKLKEILNDIKKNQKSIYLKELELLEGLNDNQILDIINTKLGEIIIIKALFFNT